MKKFMKVCGITALVLLILGFVLAFAAGTAEGTKSISEVVERVTKGKVHVNLRDFDDNFGIFIGEEDSELLYDIDETKLFDDDYEIFRGDVDKFAVGSGVSKLDIEAGGCAFYLEPSEDSNFYIESSGNGKFQCYIRNETLHIKTSHTLKDWKQYKDFEITLYIPADYTFKEAKVELGAGYLGAPELLAKEMDLTVGAGQIEVSKLVADTCEIEVGMGEILLEGVEVTKMDAEVGMGHLLLEGTILGNVDAECSMGSIEMSLSGREEEFNYNLEAAMGNVSIGNKDYSGLAHDKAIRNSADKTMNIECAMGNIEVNFAD